MKPIEALAPLAGAALRTQPDERLVALTREGHRRAFEEITRRYRPNLVSFAAGFVRPSEAEDVVQDSLSNAYTAMRSSESEISLRAWLYAIVRNRALNAIRDERSHEQLDEEYDGVPQPPDVLASKQQLAALIADLQSLPEAQRSALVKRELEGASHDEIAAELGTTKGSVRQLIFRARAGLRNRLGLLLPMPLLRMLLDAGSGAGAVGAAAVGTGGGAALALKTGAIVVAGIVAVGSGLRIAHNHAEAEKASPNQARAAETSSEASHHASASGRPEAAVAPVSSSGRRDDSSGSDDQSGGGSGSSGPGSGTSGPSEGGEAASSGPSGSSGHGGDSGDGSGSDGTGFTGTDDRSGSGGGSNSGSGPGEIGTETSSPNSGPGSGSSGDDGISGGGGSESSGSGSGSSGGSGESISGSSGETTTSEGSSGDSSGSGSGSTTTTTTSG